MEILVYENMKKKSKVINFLNYLSINLMFIFLSFSKWNCQWKQWRICNKRSRNYHFKVRWNIFKGKKCFRYLYFLSPLNLFKACMCIFFHQIIGFQKLWEMLISSKKFLLSWYSKFCNFFPFHTFQIQRTNESRIIYNVMNRPA